MMPGLVQALGSSLLRKASFTLVAATMLVCSSGCARRPPPPAHGGPLELRRGFLFVPPRFKQNGRVVEPGSAKERLRKVERSSGHMDTADNMQLLANIAAVATWMVAAWQMTDGFGQGTEGKQAPTMIAGGAAFVTWVGFSVASDVKLAHATEAYNRPFIERRELDPARVVLSPPEARPVVQPTASALQVEHAEARARAWLIALQQKDAELLAASMETPATFRGLAPAVGEARDACAPGKDPAKPVSVRVTDAEGLAKAIACLLNDAELMSALPRDPALLQLHLADDARLVGPLARFSASVQALRLQSLVFEMRHAEEPIVYGFVAVRTLEGDEVGSVMALVVTHAE